MVNDLLILSTIKNMLEKKTPYPSNSVKTKAITRAIAVFIAGDLRPLSVVDRQKHDT